MASTRSPTNTFEVPRAVEALQNQWHGGARVTNSRMMRAFASKFSFCIFKCAKIETMKAKNKNERIGSASTEGAFMYKCRTRHEVREGLEEAKSRAGPATTSWD